MARSEKDQLIVELEARVRDFERGMQRAAGTADKQFGKINRSAKQSALSMQKTMQGAVTRVNGVLSKLGIAGLAGGGVAGTVAAVAGIAKEITATGDAARRAGTDFRTFQQLSYVARVNRIEVDKLGAGCVVPLSPRHTSYAIRHRLHQPAAVPRKRKNTWRPVARKGGGAFCVMANVEKCQKSQ